MTKLIKFLVAVDLLSLLIAGVLFFLALSSIQASREAAALRTCYLLRELVLHATPPNHLHAATVYMNGTPLRDCNAYAQLPK